jgi:hypothetical protein
VEKRAHLKIKPLLFSFSGFEALPPAALAPLAGKAAVQTPRELKYGQIDPRAILDSLTASTLACCSSNSSALPQYWVSGKIDTAQVPSDSPLPC